MQRSIRFRQFACVCFSRRSLLGRQYFNVVFPTCAREPERKVKLLTCSRRGPVHNWVLSGAQEQGDQEQGDDVLLDFISIVPSPLRSLKWRLRWLSGTLAFERAPVSSTLKFMRWTALELFDRDAEFDTSEGVRLRSMAKNFSSLSVYLTGQRDPELQAFIARRLKPGQTFVDVGANIGVYSVFASRLVGPAGRVLAIEANPGTHRYLADNVTKNGLANVTTLNCAVGDADGELRISADRRNAGATHVASGDEGGVTVPVRRLDDLLRDQGITSVHYMKIDVEGYELPVLHGAVDAIRRIPDIVVQTELIAGHASRYGHSIGAIVEFLTGAGLTPYSPDERGRALPVGLNEIDQHMDLLWMRSP